MAPVAGTFMSRAPFEPLIGKQLVFFVNPETPAWISDVSGFAFISELSRY